MHNFLTGIFFWIALSVCLIGMLVRFVLYFNGLSWRLDRVAYKAHPMYGFKGAVRSIYKWVILSQPDIVDAGPDQTICIGTGT